MRSRPASRAAFAGVSLLATMWAAPGRPAQAQTVISSTLIPTSSYLSTSAYIPTSTVISSSSFLPTSYVVPTSTILPMSYVVPTSSVYATSSILETGYSTYFPTSYVSTFRRGLFRPRRFVERTSYYATPTSYFAPPVYTPTSYLTTGALLPTSYLVPTTTYLPATSYLPTTYISGASIAPTSYLIDDSVVPTTMVASNTGPACVETVSPSYPAEDPTPTRSVAPRVMAPASNTITSQQANPAASRPAERAPSAATSPTGGDDGIPSNVTPAAPTPPKAPAESGTPPSVDVPTIPAPGTLGTGAKEPQTDEGVNRTSFKPVSYSGRSIARNILRGRVVSETGNLEEGVSVIVASRTNAYEDRVALTDAEGEFKVSLPDGDWVVKVTMPSKRVYSVGRTMTASGGRVVEPNGKPVGEMIITR